MPISCDWCDATVPQPDHLKGALHARRLGKNSSKWVPYPDSAPSALRIGGLRRPACPQSAYSVGQDAKRRMREERVRNEIGTHGGRLGLHALFAVSHEI